MEKEEFNKIIDNLHEKSNTIDNYQYYSLMMMREYQESLVQIAQDLNGLSYMHKDLIKILEKLAKEKG
jgi:lipopolysaccharide biosynthesis protein